MLVCPNTFINDHQVMIPLPLSVYLNHVILHLLGNSGIPGAAGLPGEPGRQGQDGFPGRSGTPGQKVWMSFRSLNAFYWMSSNIVYLSKIKQIMLYTSFYCKMCSEYIFKNILFKCQIN